MSFTRLRFHIVTATANRVPWITAEIESYLYSVFRDEASRRDSAIIALGGVEDHVHWVIAIPPKHAIAKVVGGIKSSTTKALHKKFSHLEEFAWQPGYGGFSLSPWDMKGILSYVENQKVHHEQGRLIDHYERVEDSGNEVVGE